MPRTFFKVIQLKTYNCLSHRLGIYFAYAGCIVVLYGLLHFGEELMEWSQHQYDVAFNAYHDNIASRSFQSRLCSDVPVDVVYTWVNGSDPDLISELNKIKQQIDFNSTHSKNVSDDACNLNDCILLPLVIVSPVLSTEQLAKVTSDYSVKTSFELNVPQQVLENVERNVSVLRFDTTLQSSSAYLEANVMNHTITKFHVTTEEKAPYSMRLHKALIFKSIPNTIKTNAELMEKLPKNIKDLLDWSYMNSDKHIACVWLKDIFVVNEFVDEKKNSSLKSGFKLDQDTVTVHSAFFVGTVESQGQEDVVSKSRFEDNEELRYSLRSIEKYAPWVRHIYVVTNGQIPYWLNMDSPHLTLVTHEEIFVNKSHLPTFSSPAIEAHLHRIPGLADKFIYFNDDVAFGKEVWPDDFYTHSSGQKVYLTWPVPNCAEGCAPTWITDGYCDSACNVSDCNWDGGDCTGPNVKAGVGMSNSFGSNWQAAFISYCKPGCSNAWLADKFCDQACNTYKCGFDAGDCGLGKYSELFKITSKLKNGTTYKFPPGKAIGYVDISKTFQKVLSASYEDNANVRTAAVSNKFHVITVIFHLDGNETEVSFNVTGIPLNNSADGKKKGDNEESVFLQFKVAAFPSQNITNATDVTNAENEEYDGVEDEPEEVLKSSENKNLHDAIFIDVAEDMKRPTVRKREEVPDRHLPIELNEFNNTLLPKLIQKQVEKIKGEYEKEFLTYRGYKSRLYDILNPYFEVIKIHNDALLEKKDKKIKKIPIVTEVEVTNDVQDSVKKELQRNAIKEIGHSHIKGDPGLLEITDKTSKPGVLRISNVSETFKSRRIFSIETILHEQPPGVGFLPWERNKEFKEFLEKNEEREKISDQYKTTFKLRKLLDTFGDSLRFVSRLYNKRFGFTQRKVPAHMPHMIDKNIMYELQAQFSKEYDMTSSHKFRHSQDMQFAFSYFYYLMSERKILDFSAIFNEFDTDQSGVLSDREIRLFATRMFDMPLSLEELTSVENAFKQCAWKLYGSDKNLSTNINVSHVVYTQPTIGLEKWAITEKYYEKDMPLVTKDLMWSCSFIIDLINKTYAGEKKYKFQEVDQNEIAFKMIRDNVSTVVGQLDDIRKNPKKFICLNDNINHNLEQSSTVKAVIRDFYETLFPLQSKFELPYEYRNRFSNIRELREWKRNHEMTLHILHIALGFLFTFMVISLFWEHIFKVWRRYRYIIMRKTLLKFCSTRKRRLSPV